MPNKPPTLADRIELQQIPDPDPDQFDRFAAAVARLLTANVLKDAQEGAEE